MYHKKGDGDKRADARVTRTRALLREAMLALLQHDDAHSITAQRVVAHAGVGYATFFRHYPGVDALLLDLADELMGRLVKQAAPALLRGDAEDAVRLIVEFAAAHRNASAALLVGGGDAVRQEVTARAIRYAEELSLPFDPSLPRELAVQVAVAGIITILRWWLTQGSSYSSAEVRDLVARLTMRPLVGSPEHPPNSSQ